MYYNIFLDISQLSPPATWSSSKNSQTYVGWHTLSPWHCESHLNVVTLLPLTSSLWMALLSTSSVGSFCSVGEDSIFSFFSVFLVSFFTLGLDIWSKSAPLSFIFNISNLVWLHLFWFVFNRTVIYLEYQRLVYASPLWCHLTTLRNWWQNQLVKSDDTHLQFHARNCYSSPMCWHKTGV